MGLFYTNTTLRLADQNPVIDFMKTNRRTGYISPVINGYVVVFDRETEDQNETAITKLTSKFSRQLKCVAFTVLILDGDIFAYWLYRNGKWLDKYNAIPNYFDDKVDSAPTGGNASKLCEALDVLEAFAAVQHLFDRLYRGNVDDVWDEGFLIGEDVHRQFVKVLGLPVISVETGFYTIENDFGRDDLDKSSLVRC